LAWSNTIELATDFEGTFTKLSNRVETARNWKLQLSWKSYKKWYVKLVRKDKSALRALKKNLSRNTALTSILQQLQYSLARLHKVETPTELKWQALGTSKQIWAQFRAELDRQVKSEYDMFRKREFEPDPRLCFVLMPFDKPEARQKPFMQVYKVIRSAVRQAKLKCKRADQIFGVKPIVQDIWESINKAALIIADLTGRNANVFYEAGLSHALPKKLVLLAQTMDDVPFDVRHIRIILYSNSNNRRKKLKKELYKTIKSALE
jgi:hypothetical protein